MTWFERDRFFHVYNRGAGRAPIFFQQQDYITCLELLKKYRRKYAFTVVAYALLPNHYHFLLRQDGNVAPLKMVGVLFNSYVQKVNLRLGRTGTLFEGRARRKPVDDLVYLLRLCLYIHTNAYRAGLCDAPIDWPYSNLPEWLGERDGTLFDRSLVDLIAPDRAAYRQAVRQFALTGASNRMELW